MANGKAGRKGVAKAKHARAGSDRLKTKKELREAHLNAAMPEDITVSKPSGLKELRKQDTEKAISAKAAKARAEILADPDTEAEILVHESPNDPRATKIVSDWVASGTHTPSSLNIEPKTKAGMIAIEEHDDSPSEVKEWESGTGPSYGPLKM